MTRRSLETGFTPTLFDGVDPCFLNPFEHPDARGLVALAVALGAADIAGWSAQEKRLAVRLPCIPPAVTSSAREAILDGLDPLGELFCRLRSADERRSHGATYTPLDIVDAMVEWAAEHAVPSRVVDPGLGSGRYLAASGRRFKQASLVGIEIDPLPAIIARANLAVHGFQNRAAVILADYRSVPIPPVEGRTLYIGNPPYVRHHLLEPKWKQWLVDEASRRGFAASQLAGLHVHFFLATVLKAARQDFGAFITAAEWLDVNYGRLVRELFLGPLGGRRIVVVEPTALPFPDAATTAAITYFEVGSRPKDVVLKRIKQIGELKEPDANQIVRRERLETESRWSHLTRIGQDVPAGYVELGEICRVHRGQVTGANKVWIAGPHSTGLPPSVLFPSVTKALELFRAGLVLDDPSALRRVIDLPVELDSLDPRERRAVNEFLQKAEEMGADVGYIASNRKAWWSVGLRKPAPILATYMARRPPAFVHNKAMARHINIAHGLYPREPMPETVLQGLVTYLSKSTHVSQGRTYAGGLTKFEPREMERIPVPHPRDLSGVQL